MCERERERYGGERRKEAIKGIPVHVLVNGERERETVSV